MSHASMLKARRKRQKTVKLIDGAVRKAKRAAKLALKGPVEPKPKKVRVKKEKAPKEKAAKPAPAKEETGKAESKKAAAGKKGAA